MGTKTIQKEEIRENSRGDIITVWYTRYYNEDSYVVTHINGVNVKDIPSYKRHGAYETLHNAIKSTEY